MALLPLPLTISLGGRSGIFQINLPAWQRRRRRLSFSVSYDEDDGNVAFVIVIRPLGVGTIPTRAHIAHVDGWM